MQPEIASALLNAGAGLAVLLFGRRLFWLFVGLAGFVAAASLVPLFLADAPPWLAIGVGLVLGAIGARLAIKLQFLAAGLAGALVGGSIGYSAALEAAVENAWLVGVVGALGGSILISLAFQPALKLLSSVLGAFAIVTAARPLVGEGVDPAVFAGAFCVLTAIGLAFQFRRGRRK